MHPYFADIIGHDEPIGMLSHALAAGRLPHGLIFSGPRGVGKFTTARAMAKLFLAPEDEQQQAHVAHLVETGNHPDFHVVSRQLIRFHDKTGKSKGIDLSIQVLRPELIEPAGRKSAAGVGKVFVIEEAETMNTAAQNGILKTLEEPHGRTLIILLTDQLEGLLPTIRSRCQTVRFGRLSDEAATGILTAGGLEPKQAAAAVRLADGAPGQAMQWIEDGVIDGAKELYRLLEQIDAGRDPNALPTFFKTHADAYAERQLVRDPLSSKDQATRTGLSVYLRIAADRYRKRLPGLNDPDAAEAACLAIDAIVRCEQLLEGNVNTSIALQQLAFALSPAGK